MERHTRSYLRLIKPGITISNTMSGIAGFFLAVTVVGASLLAPATWAVFGAAMGGIALVIASACVVNNILDRKMDAKMKRTLKRGIVDGSITIPKAVVFAVVLGGIGFALLFFWTNLLTFWLGVLAYVWYVVIYGYTKRTTVLSTVIGGVAGSLPPVAGYTALTGALDPAAVVLFAILYFWQLPHFYAISMWRKDDYAKADVPVWAVRYGLKSTKRQIFISVVLYAFSAPLLTLFGYTGIIYLVISTGLSAYWLYKGVTLYKKVDDIKWSKVMFGISLLVLMAMCALIAVGGFLP